MGAPLLISCMTGGVPEAERINRILARTAQAYGFALGLGSARVLLEHPEVLSTFAVRGEAPDVLLLANLGAVQLNKGVGIRECRRVLDLLQADVLVLHLNALQEALQPEGDTNFSGILRKIEALCREIDVPVVAKEIGWGISADQVVRLLEAGVSAVDVAGAGGTSWSEVERHRMSNPLRARIAAAFADWGIPSAEAIQGARRAAPDATIFASGGIRDGIDVAKAIALGANLAGVAGPFLRAANDGEDAAQQLAEELVEVLRIAMFAIGASNINSLRQTSRLVSVDGGDSTGNLSVLMYETSRARDFIDITDDVADAVQRTGVSEGIVHVCSLHTTAAIRINENEPLLIADFQEFLRRLVPSGDLQHNDLSRRDGVPPDEPQNGHAHLLHLLLSSSETIAIVNGKLQLGQWQRLFLIELDDARKRQVTIQVVGR